jgi:hypothetical protein
MNEQQFFPIHNAQQPTEEGKRLVALFNDLENKQLDFIDEAGKSLIERIATFLTVLFGITAFGSTFPPAYLKGNPSAKALVVVTTLLYLAAMAAGIWTIQPRYYRRYINNVSRLGSELEKITRHKMFWLRVGGIIFGLGSLTLAALIISIIWAV